MNIALGIQGIVIEAGVLLVAAAGGIGAHRYFTRSLPSLLSLPGQMERCACALEHSVSAMEEHNTLGTMVADLRNLVVTTRDELYRAKAEQEHFRREIRILARRIEGYSIYAHITQ